MGTDRAPMRSIGHERVRAFVAQSAMDSIPTDFAIMVN
jgi:hypothetical protein